MLDSQKERPAVTIGKRDVSPRLAAGPPTAAALARITSNVSFPDIANFNLGFKVSDKLSNPSAQTLSGVLEDFRQTAADVRCRKWHSFDLSEPGMLSRRKLVSLFVKIRNDLHVLDIEHSSKSFSHDYRGLLMIANEAVNFVRTRPARMANFQFGNMVRTLLDAGNYLVGKLEYGDNYFPEASGSNGEHLTEQLRALFHTKRSIGRRLVHAKGDDHSRAVRSLYESHDMRITDERVGYTALLARKLTREFFAKQHARIVCIGQAIEAFVSEPSMESFSRLQSVVREMNRSVLRSEDITQNPYTTNENEVRRLSSRLEDILNAVDSTDLIRAQDTIETVAMFPDLLRLQHTWESWTVFGSELHSHHSVDQLHQRLYPKDWFSISGLRHWWNRTWQAVHADNGAMLNFEFGGNDQSAWSRLEGAIRLQPEFFRDFLTRFEQRKCTAMQRALRAVRRNTEETVKSIGAAHEFLLPSEAPIFVSEFQKSEGTIFPDELLNQVMELQRQNLVDLKMPAAQEGLATVIPKATLRDRIDNYDATVLCMFRGDELFGAHVSCSNHREFPALGRDLQEILYKHLQVSDSEVNIKAHLAAPLVLADLMVGHKDVHLLRRNYREPTNIAMHQQFETMVLAQHMGEPIVHVVGICRKDPVENLARKSLERMGYRALPNVEYRDAEGHLHYVMHLQLSPLHDLLR